MSPVPIPSKRAQELALNRFGESIIDSYTFYVDTCPVCFIDSAWDHSICSLIHLCLSSSRCSHSNQMKPYWRQLVASVAHLQNMYCNPAPKFHNSENNKQIFCEVFTPQNRNIESERTIKTENETASTLFSFIPPPHHWKGYCIFCWKFEVERGRLRQREGERERKALPGFPPFGISRPGSAWREQLHYLPPPTPLNLPWPQNIL